MENRQKKLLTLCMVHQHPRVLLGMKKRGFGAGRWNGFGGKLAEGETIEDAALREIVEEVGITPKSLEKRGIIEFEFKGTPGILEVHIFHVDSFRGEPHESEEMKPQWFHVNDIPFHDMWPDDIHWMPLFLEGRRFRGRFLFGESDKILEMELNKVIEL